MPKLASPRLGAYLEEWLDRRVVHLRPSTLRGYRQIVRSYLEPHLGGRRLDELDRRQLEALYGRLLQSGGQGGRALSPRTVQYVHAVLSRALEDAVLDGLLSVNPARSARPPRRRPDEDELEDHHRIWTADEAMRFLAFVDDHPWRALWHLALGTGARRGELLGLRWQDVDLDAAEVRIRRALSVVDGVPRLLATKTANRRVLSVGATVVDALTRQRVAQHEQREAARAWRNRWELVFTDAAGEPLDPMAVTREFAALVRRAPIPVVRLHDTRHFHATALLAAGVPVTVVSQRLGHASVTMTLDVYGHVMPASDGQAARQLETMLHGDGQ